MTKLEQAARQALEALLDYHKADDDRVSVAMSILQEALAAQALQKLSDFHQMMEKEPVAWGYFDADGSFMDALDRQHGAYQTPLYTTPQPDMNLNCKSVQKRLATVWGYVKAEQAECNECGAKQAQIDRLMLEYCPDEMTPEQMREWGNNQRPAKQAEQEPFDMDDHPPHRLCECRKCMEYFTPLPDCDAFAAFGKPIAEQTNTQLMEGFRPVSEMVAEHKQDPKKAAAIEKAKMRKAEQKPVAVVEITYGREPECYVTGNIDDFPEGVFKLYAAPFNCKGKCCE